MELKIYYIMISFQRNSFIRSLALVVPMEFVNDRVHSISGVGVAETLTVLWVILYCAYFIQGIGQTLVLKSTFSITSVNIFLRAFVILSGLQSYLQIFSHSQKLRIENCLC